MPIEQISSRIANALGENDQLKIDIELLRGANLELRGENKSLRAEVEKMRAANDALKKALGAARDWNLLDDDRPEHLFIMYQAMALLRGEGE